MAGSFVRKSMVSTAALLLAIGLSGCLGGGGGADITPTSGSGGVSSGGGGGSTGGGSTGGNSGGGAPGGSGGATADEGFAVQVSGKADTDANGDPARLGNLQTDGPRGITAQTTSSNGYVLNYGNGAKTATFSNCNTNSGVTSCSASSGDSLTITKSGIGTSSRPPNTYQYLSLGTWEKLPGNNATSAPFSVIGGVAGQKTVNMPATGSATYKGTAEMDVAENGSVSATNPVTLDANVDLTADFANKKVTGSLHSFEDSLSGSSIPGTINLQQGTISGSTLSANLGGNINGENVTGSMKGMFYGPNAGEVGGAFTLQSNSSPRKAVGVFAAKKQ